MAIFSFNESLGRYTVRNRIKSNPYTETYRIVDADNHPFFLKIFDMGVIPTVLVNEDTKEVREIEYAERIKHRNIVSFIEKGSLDREDGAYRYYVTNYFIGSVLSDLIAREGPMEEEKALSVFRALSKGISYLHSQAPALCHNDLDLSNVMLSATNEEPVVIDLGHVSPRCTGSVHFDTSNLDIFYHGNETQSGIFDEQGDIFSLCCILYTMLTGVAPWKTDIEGNSFKDRMKALWLFRKNTPLQLDALQVSDQCRALLSKGLSLKSVDRFASVEEMLDLLDGNEIPSSQGDSGSESRLSSQNASNYNGQGDGNGDNNYARVDVEIKRGGGNGFKDIAGMQELKDYLFQRVIFVLQNKDLAAEYRITPPNGLLLYGPPGCGKSFFAEKFAEETGYNFMLVKSSDLVCGIHHSTEMRIKNLFELAAKNAPIVICFDEFDALVPDRGARGNEYEAKEVNEMLAQLNNCSKRGIFVVASTNRPDKIDPAVKRTGRIDKMYYVPLPDLEARKEMFRMYLKDRPVADNLDIDYFAKATEGYIASDIAYIVNDAAMVAAYSKQQITKDLLQSTLDAVPPSLDKNCLEEYDDLRKDMNRTARRIVIESL